MISTVPLKWAADINRSELAETTPGEFEFRYIDISSVDSNGGVDLPLEPVLFATAPSRARRLAPGGATLVSTVRTYLRAIARVPEDGLVFSTGFATVEARPGVDADFLYYGCRSDSFVEEVVARSTGVSYPAINPSELGMIHVGLPSYADQRRIADFLDDQVSRIDQAIRARRRQAVVLQEQIGVVAHSEVTGAMCSDRKPSQLAWSRDLPTWWESTRLANVARLGTGHTPSRSKPEYWIDCDIPWVTTTDVKRFRYDGIDSIVDTEVHISQPGLRNSAAVMHPAGTVVLTRTSASAGSWNAWPWDRPTRRSTSLTSKASGFPYHPWSNSVRSLNESHHGSPRSVRRRVWSPARSHCCKSGSGR